MPPTKRTAPIEPVDDEIVEAEQEWEDDEGDGSEIGSIFDKGVAELELTEEDDDEGTVIGRVERTEDSRRKPPLNFTMVGYDADSGEERRFRFRCRGNAPMGAGFDFAGAIKSDGSVDTVWLMRFMSKAIVTEDRNGFSRILDNPQIEFEPEMFLELIEKMFYEWTGENFRSRSERRRGPQSKSRTTSRGHARSRASTSRART